MTFLVKKTLFHLLLLNLDVLQTPEVTHRKSMGTTEVTELRYFRFENCLKNKLEVYLPYKNYVINSVRTPLFTFLHFPEDIMYCSCKCKASKKLEGSNISIYEVYVERS